MAQKTKKPDAAQCVIYARYSSLAQRDQSIEDQVAACERWATSHGLNVYDVYADRHISGTTDSRPAFQQMIQDAAQGAWATVVVYKVDRFARDKADAAIYRRKLRELGVSVESAMESIPDGPEGVILEGMLDAFAEYYSRNLSQNVKRGMYSNAEKCMANGVPVFGYRTAADGTYEIDPDMAPIVQEMFARRAAGESIESIARWMGSAGVRTKFGNKPTVCFTRGRLADRRYLGIYKFGDIEIPGGMPQLIDKETWESVRASRYYRKQSAEQRLKGRVFDLETNTPFTCEYATSHSGKRYHYYSIKLPGQKRERISSAKLDQLVADTLRAALADRELAHQIALDAVALAEREANGPSIRGARKRLEEIKTETSRLVDSIAAGVPADIVQPKLTDLNMEQKDCEAVLLNAPASVPTVEEVELALTTRYADYALQYDDLCRAISSVHIDRCAGYVMCEMAWGETSAARLPKNKQTRRQAAGSKNSHWLAFNDENRTYWAAPFRDCVLLRVKAPFLQ